MKKYDPSAIEEKWPHSVPLRQGSGGASRGKQNYDPSVIESYWQKVWIGKGIYEPDLKRVPKPFDKAQGEPFYNLVMFPYPSAEGLHVGNMYCFTGSDIYGRYKRMQGCDVFEPIGLDGFGIHSENYALKVGRHPLKQAKISEKNFYRQLHATGNGYAWKEKLETYDPEYYRWTQWIFIQLFKHGLAYRAKAQVNWCPSCKTVLSDEQVVMGACERCKTPVVKKELEQWFFKITQYAEKLLGNLNHINWSERVKIAQRNWIGKSEGAEINFPIANCELQIEVFTTRPDTLFGATFMVLSPKHPAVAELQKINKKVNQNTYKLIDNYIKKSQKTTEEEKIAEGREKTGVFTGFSCLNPVSGETMPIWVADYVLMGYGTGAIMAVPAHDQRDFDFAKKYHLPIKAVIAGGDSAKEAYDREGPLINSGPWDGWKMPQEMNKVTEWLTERKIGQKKVTYRLRDWCVSRQRYWGPPIPMIHCPKCARLDPAGQGWQPVPEKDLPVLLPEVKDWRPKGAGKSPLATVESFVNVTCPKCGGTARRETDVSDTFLDSAWYFFRYPSTRSARSGQVPFDNEITKKWLPVDMYIGGAEHAVLHLLYTRFLTMVFKDLNFIDFSAKGGLADEPFERFYANGLLIFEGAKMSKSKGNIIIPDIYISRYGADTLRCYLMFLGPFDQGGDFRDLGILGIWRFLNRVWKLATALGSSASDFSTSDSLREKTSIYSRGSSSLAREDLKIGRTSPALFDLERIRHQTIKKVTEDIEGLRYNTALAALMEYYNQLSIFNSQLSIEDRRQAIKTLLLLLAPFAPHLTEELWAKLGEKFSIHNSFWPQYDNRLIKEEKVTLVVCINGKMREKLELQTALSQNQKEVEKLALQSSKVQKYLNGKDAKKTVFIPGKLINFVV